MNYKSTNFPIEIRNNDDFVLHIDGLSFDITPTSPKLILKASDGTLIDWSQYIVKTSTSAFTISVKASIIALLGAFKNQYDCYIDLGNGSNEHLFSGVITSVLGVKI